MSDSVTLLQEYIAAIIVFNPVVGAALSVLLALGSGFLNSSFRWGKGLAITSPDTITVYASDRNVLPLSRIPLVGSDKDFSVVVWTNGSSQGADRLVPSTGMSSSPSAVNFASLLYCFHQGSGDNGELWYNTFDGNNWAGDQLVPNTGMSESPAAVVFNGKLYCFHQGSGDNGELWYNTFDGNNWAGDQLVPNTGMSESPGVVVADGRLYCFHQGSGDSGELWYNTFDGNNWAGDQLVANTGMSSSPSPVVFGDQLCCLHQGSANIEQLWMHTALLTSRAAVKPSNVA